MPLEEMALTHTQLGQAQHHQVLAVIMLVEEQLPTPLQVQAQVVLVEVRLVLQQILMARTELQTLVEEQVALEFLMVFQALQVIAVALVDQEL
jgi:hypothetical protein